MEKLIIDEYNKGKTIQQLAEIADISYKAMSMRLSRYRKDGLIGRTIVPWSTQEDAKLIEYRLAEYKNKDIAEMLGRSENSVKGRASAFMLLGRLPKHEGPSWLVGLNSMRKPGGCHNKGNPTILYLVYFIDEDLYKIGITQKSIVERFYGAPKYLIIDSITTDLETAWEFETAIKDRVQKQIPLSDWFERNGKTECFKYFGSSPNLEDLL